MNYKILAIIFGSLLLFYAYLKNIFLGVLILELCWIFTGLLVYVLLINLKRIYTPNSAEEKIKKGGLDKMEKAKIFHAGRGMWEVRKYKDGKKISNTIETFSRKEAQKLASGFNKK